MSLSHNMNAASGSSLDGVAVKKEPEYYLQDGPSTSGSDQLWKHIKQEPAVELPLYYGELDYKDEAVFICHHCQRSWKSFILLRRCVQKCFHSTFTTDPGSSLDGVAVKKEPKYYLHGEPSTSGNEQVWKHVKQEPDVELPTYYGELEHKYNAVFICHHCQRTWKSFILLRCCVRKCFHLTVTKFRLKKLMSPSTGVKISSSYKCSKQELNLSKEYSPATSEAEKRFACCECSYSADYRHLLNEHILSKHSNDKPHSCPYCEYSTVQGGTLKHHIEAKHSNNKPHSCPYCEFSAVRAGHLKNHIMAKHSNDKPHSCPFCEYSTVRAFTLKEHILAKHLNDKPHSCPHCEYSTVQAGHLKEHILAKHSIYKPHSCPYCVYTSVQAGRLKLHILAKHLNDKPHSCPYCEYSAVRADANL